MLIRYRECALAYFNAIIPSLMVIRVYAFEYAVQWCTYTYILYVNFAIVRCKALNVLRHTKKTSYVLLKTLLKEYFRAQTIFARVYRITCIFAHQRTS